jgi:hypothetical protein
MLLPLRFTVITLPVRTNPNSEFRSTSIEAIEIPRVILFRPIDFRSGTAGDLRKVPGELSLLDARLTKGPARL